MNISYKISHNNLTLYLDGELDECSASNVKPILDKLILDNLNANKIIFDLSDVSFMDSTGVGLLLGRYKKISKFNLPVYIGGTSVAVDKVLSISGIYSIMPKC